MKKVIDQVFPFFLVVLLVFPQMAWAQFSVKTGEDPQELIKTHLIGEGIKVRNARFTGNPVALGSFENPSATPGFMKGVILSTGNAADIVGPNDNPKTTTRNDRGGDKDLFILAKGRTFDVALLEFDIQAARDSISLNFFFASEEYNDYVGSSFSDAIIIRISGPGFANGKNLAVVPGTQTPINVNTVNYHANGKYYIDNNPFTLAGRVSEKRKAELNPDLLDKMQFDGFTRVFSVGTKVKPKSTYRVKIGIADAGDGKVDSALLIEAGSFQSMEQHRWVVRRQKIAEQRRLDSLVRVAFVMDSLAREQAILDSIAAIAQAKADRLAAIAQAKTDSIAALEQAKADSLANLPPVPAEPGEEVPFERPSDPAPPAKGPDTPYAEAMPDTPPSPGEKPVLAVDGPQHHAPPPPSAVREYQAIIRYAEDDIIIPDSSERLLKEVMFFLNNDPGLRVGIYVPGNSENSKLRFDLIRLELIKSGLKPNRIFRNGFSFLAQDAPRSRHRAEIWLRPGE
ncbi:MAG TPA: hypothetical protein ENJ82_13745 [Bacteroidetes bacterium]|nr:hypothetical protein [Bacteroidota bacterium]